MALDWFLRLLKGTLIGTGAILPGVSGGALAAVFGLYRRMIAFLVDPHKEFAANVWFFLPVGIGMALGVFALSFVVSWLLEAAGASVIWFFAGCIAGTLPPLWKQAGEQGRSGFHVLAMLGAGAWSFLLLRQDGASPFLPALDPSPLVWLLGGAVVGLGAVIPGLSPSNFLIRLDLYKPMADGIKSLDAAVTLPLLAGAVAVALLLSKAVNRAYSKAYAMLSHVVFGLLAASTAAILPGIPGLAEAGALGAGVLFGWAMSRLEGVKSAE